MPAAAVMEMRARWARPAFFLLALTFAVATLLYSALWMAAARSGAVVELGFDATYTDADHSLTVTAVRTDSPAERAGLRRDDRIVALDGHALDDVGYQPRVWSQRKPGDTIRVTIARSGESKPLILLAVFRATAPGPFVEALARGVRSAFPLPFVFVGLAVLFLRLEDSNAWILALLLAAFTAISGVPDGFAAGAPALRPLVMAYRAVLLGLSGPLFYFLFARFPTQSPLDRWMPWLKWVAIALGLAFAVPGLASGELQLPAGAAAAVGPRLSRLMPACHVFLFFALGLVALVATRLRTRDVEAVRRIRVIFWGTLVGVAPALALASAQYFSGFRPPWWLDTANTLVLFVFPLSFAYAVVKHRVLDIPVLLERSARYLLVQRGFTVGLALVSVGLTWLFAVWFARGRAIEPAEPMGVALGAVFGTALLWGGSRVHRQVSRRIDRAFFRRSYDARVILEDLAERTRGATDRAELAALLQRSVAEALQPRSVVVYLKAADDRLTAVTGRVPPDLETISSTLPILVALAARGQPWDVTPGGEARAEDVAPLVRLDPDCLVPMLSRGGGLVGLLVLGPRLSEEPYSREDRRMLASVAGQAGIAFENIGLAEEIAERIQRERWVAREMAIAKEVQGRLLPPVPTTLKTLDCAAQCIQAQSVGGDAYDFLDLGEERVGLVLADVSGKGVHAALLMANLQAHLRSQSGLAPLDLARALQEVNRLMWASTAGKQYATVFFGVYDERTRRLVYANCGHNPPICLRSGGRVERLPPTGTVIGLFDRWEGSVGQIGLEPGDLLAIFSDGVTEATSGENEFGEERLIQELQAQRTLAVNDLVTTVLAGVQRFSGGSQWDDLTLVVARGRE